MALWKLIIADDRQLSESMRGWVRDNKRISIGWGHTGKLSAFDNVDAIQEVASKKYPHVRHADIIGKQLWDFYKHIAIGDLVILVKESRYATVQIVGDYLFDNENYLPNTDYYHQRKISFTNHNPDRLWSEASVVDGYNANWPLSQLKSMR